MEEKKRKTGIDIIGDVPWGTHFCQFYQTKEDLIDILVPYFKAGLENNEFCMWVTSEPLNEKEAEKAMRGAVPDLDQYLKKGQIEIVPYIEWYLKDGVFNLQRVLNAWIDKLNQALAKGYDGIRVTGNTAWLKTRDWKTFADYEEQVDGVIGKYQMISICTYSLDKCGATEVIDVVKNHQFALIRREGKWAFIESSERKRAEEEQKKVAQEWNDTFSSIADLVFIIDKEANVVRGNQAFEDFCRSKGKNPVGEKCYRLLHDLECHYPNCPFEEVLHTKKPFSYEINDPYIGLPLLVGLSPMLDKNGEVRAIVHIAKDITERRRAAEALTESEKRYRSLFKSMLNGFAYCKILVDEKNQPVDFVYLEVNNAFERLTGLKKENVIGEKVTEAIPSIKKTHPELFDIYGKVALTGKEDEFDIHFKPLDIWLSISVYSPKKYYFCAVFENITERKKAEEEIRTERDKLENVTRNIGVGLAIISKDYQTVWANEVLKQIFGEVEGKLCFQTYNLRKDICPGCGVREVFEKGKEMVVHEQVGKDKEGETIWSQIIATPVKDKDGNITGAMEVVVPITERKKAEEALKENEERYRGLIERLNDAVYRMSLPDGNYEYFSPAAKSVFGYSSEEFLNNPLLIKKIIHPDFAEYFQEKFSDLIRGKVPPTYEYKIIDSEGNERWIIQSNTGIFNHKGEIIAIEGICRNVTERKKAEEDIKQSAREWETTFNSITDLVSIQDKDLKLIRVNKACADLFRVRPEELIGKTCYEVFHGTKEPLPNCPHKKTLETRNPVTEEFFDPRLQIHLEVSTSPILDEKGEVKGTIHIVKDVTERKKAEQQIRRQNAVLKAINQVFQETLTCETEEEVARKCLEVAEELTNSKFGFIGEVNQAGRFDAIALSDPGWDTCIIPKTNAVQMIKNMEIRGIWAKPLKDEKSLITNDPASHPDSVGIPEGHPQLSSFLGVPLKHVGRTMGMIALANKESGYDLSDQEAIETLSVAFVEALFRKRAEEKIKQVAREWEITFNSVKDMISIQDKDFKILKVNKAYADLFRVRPEELIGKTCYEAFHGTKEPLPNCPHLRALETKKTASAEFFDSRFEIHFEVSASPLFNKEGEVFGTVHIAKDITQRKKLQEQLIQTEKLAAVGTLAYGIAHEFNNILAGMMANAELGLITKEPQQVRESFETIVESSQRASSITNNLLAFARQKDARKELVDITEPLKSVLSVTRRELEKHNVELIEKFKSIPKIYCDPGQFSEVFLNMITNARDAMYPKGGTLTVQVEPAGDNIQVVFKDTGCGIPDSIKNKIFEPFVTTKGALGKSEIPGTGLGLFLSYGIIDGYKGKIEVDTKVGKGTKFTILIPVSKNLPREFLLDTRIESSKETERKLKILLVDDESPICSSLKKYLESRGHKVTASLRGKQGLELFKKDKFDLVLSDITMPDMDGIELIKEMKEKDQKTKIIVITGHIQQDKEEKAREAGADEVLIKPFKNELLYQTISKVVDRR